MSNKSKLIIAIVLIVVGAGLVPTGIVINNVIREQVYDGVPDALLGIRAEAIPTLEETIPVLGTPEVLKGVFDEASAGVEPLLKVKSTPSSLLGLKASINASIPDLVNFATTAQGIAGAITYLNITQGWVNGLDTFFNNASYIDPILSLPSIAMIVSNLSYTPTAQQKILVDGVFSQVLIDYSLTYSTVPGLISDTDTGTGVDIFYDTMGEAYYWKYVLSYPAPMAALMAGYNATEGQLLALASTGYIDWVIANWVPGAFLANFGITTAEAASTGFYRQWANGTFVSDGIDLGGGLKGFEVGVPEPTNISVSTCIDLWNPLHPLSFTNDDGILAWLGAAAGNATLQTLLMSTFSLTATQLTMILTWLGNFVENVTPVLVLGSTGKTISELSTLAFYEQWANGTMFGEVVLPDGFLGEITPSWAGAPYFEVGLPTVSGLSLAECIQLWDPLLDQTFIYGESFENLWYPAMQGDVTSQGTLIATFGISAGELTALLTWLGSLISLDPPTGRIADLIEYNIGLTITQIATSYFYDQWVNGTVAGEEFLPEGFLSQLDPPIDGPPYFEVGLMYKTGITIAQTLALWDETSKYSLVTVTGVNRWYQAVEGNAIHTTLKTQNGNLSDLQMAGILAWLPQFRDVIVNTLAKEDMGLTSKPYQLGQALALVFGTIGSAVAFFGVIILLGSKRK